MELSAIKEIADKIIGRKPHWSRLRKEDPEIAVLDLFELVLEEIEVDEKEESEILDFLTEKY